MNPDPRRSAREISPDLIDRARDDPGQFGDIYDHYLHRVYAFCRFQVETREEAEDLAALTFERAFAAMDRYEHRGHPFSTWLLRIAANAVADHRRRSRRARLADFRRWMGREPEKLHLDHWERALWLRDHIDSLPAEQREVVRLRFYEDQPFSSIAERMGRSEGAVKQLLRRALLALHGRMQREEDAYG